MGVELREYVATELVCCSHDVGADSGIFQHVTAFSGAMHVARNKSSYVAKSGEERVYESVLLRRTYREGGKVKHETLANLSRLPAEAVAALEATLKGQTLVPAGSEFSIVRSLPHGHVAAVAAMARQLGLATLLGPRCRARDIVVALIVSRVLRPKSKLSTLAWWPDTTLGADLGVAGACTDEVYAAMDWLAGRQEKIEKKLAAKHLAPEVNPGRMALFDLTSAWVTGRCCALAARGYSRDGKKGCEQIEYGVLTDPAGRPVAVRVFRRQHRRPGRVQRDRHRDPRRARHRSGWCWWAIAA